MENARIGNFCIGRPGAGFTVVGYPDDLGVKNVNGRPGASGGPAAFQEAFARLKGPVDVHSVNRGFHHSKIEEDLESNHDQAAQLTHALAQAMDRKKDRLIAIGGGHDYAYPWLKGIRQALGPRFRLGCLNIDAHFDLREFQPVMTSGSPFRRLIEEGILKGSNLVEFGIQNHCNGADLWAYARAKKIVTHPMTSLRAGRAVATFKKAFSALKKRVDGVALSIDLDAMSAAIAPGVSAPQPEGFSASELFEMLEWAGRDAKVFTLGVFELSPPLDVHGITARLAAQGVWKFLSQWQEHS